jgi:predicted acyl esterase
MAALQQPLAGFSTVRVPDLSRKEIQARLSRSAQPSGSMFLFVSARVVVSWHADGEIVRGVNLIRHFSSEVGLSVQGHCGVSAVPRSSRRLRSFAKNIMLPVRDGVKLATGVCVPASDGAPVAGQPNP